MARGAQPLTSPDLSHSLATRLVGDARTAGMSLAVAESLTGGAVSAALVGVVGASDVFRGGVVAYGGEVKHDVLGVAADLLAERGAVDPDVALAMAAGVRRLMHADVAVATTGVAGPGPHRGIPAGLVYIAVDGSTGIHVRALRLSGDRATVRSAAVESALRMMLSVVAPEEGVPPFGNRGRSGGVASSIGGTPG